LFGVVLPFNYNENERIEVELEMVACADATEDLNNPRAHVENS